MKRVINFLMSDPPHLHLLAVALYTLRKNYGGPVEVYAFPQSYDIVKRISEDKRLDVEAIPYEPTYIGKNCQPIERIVLMNTPGPDVRLYLDADVSVHQPLDELFELAEKHGMAFTQFNSWLCSQGIIRRRLEELRKYSNLNQEALERVIGSPKPSVNCGVYACRPDHVCLPKWRDYTIEARDIFISDERVQHIIMEEYWDDMVIASGKFNASHKYYKGPEPAHVLHYHGESSFRPDKSPLATQHWWKLYREVCGLNIGFIQEWKDSVYNKWMKIYLEKYSNWAPA